MARRRYRRYRRRQGKWSANLLRISGGGEPTQTGDFVDYVTIAQNNTTTSNTSVSQTFSVKNVEVSAILEGAVTVQSVEYYILFVPEGYAINENIPFDHPEWIMAYKFIGPAISPRIGGDVTSSAQPPKIRTRLARKLHSGDSIIFMLRGTDLGVQPSSVSFQGLVRWWTKAN